MSSPDRGEVWLVDLGYVAKVRPCLVISIPALDQDRALATLVPHTTSPRGSRFEVQVKVRFLREGAFYRTLSQSLTPSFFAGWETLLMSRWLRLRTDCFSGWDLKKMSIRMRSSFFSRSPSYD